MKNNRISPAVETLEEAKQLWPQVPLSKKQQNLTNQKINKLLCLYPSKMENSVKTFWVCQCDCGKYTIGETSSIIRNRKKSCGCEIKKNRNNLIGQKFDKLLIINIDAEFEKTRTPGVHRKWICQCDCGNICSKYENDLLKNQRLSCGCLGHSIGEKTISDYLTINNINFKQEFTFNNCLSSKKNKLRFDFAILDNNNFLKCLIEFQGIQHFKDVGIFGKQQREETDQIKYNYCKNNNIKLYYINYNENIIEKLKKILIEI